MAEGFQNIASLLRASVQSEPARYWALSGEQFAELMVEPEGIPATSLRPSLRYEAHDPSHGSATGAANDVSAFLAAAQHDLQGARLEVRQRVNRLFAAILCLGLVSSASILVAAIVVVLGGIPEATFCSVVGGLTGITAGGIWRLYSRETKHLRSLVDDLRNFERIHLAVLLADQFSDKRKRETVLLRLISAHQMDRSSGPDASA